MPAPNRLTGLAFAAVLPALSAPAHAAAPELLQAEAKAMEPSVLGDLLLPDGHPPIRDAVVHPVGMEPPAPWITQIELQSRWSPVSAPGFCQASLFRIDFAPPARPDPGPLRGPVKASPAGTKQSQILRWTAPGSGGCDAADGAGIRDLSPQDTQRAIDLIAQLAAIRARVLEGKSAGVRIAFRDDLVRDLGIKGPRKRRQLGEWRSARDAMAWLNLERSRWYGQPDVIYGEKDPFPPARADDEKHSELLLNEGRVVALLRAGKVTRIYLHRAIPAPF